MRKLGQRPQSSGVLEVVFDDWPDQPLCIEESCEPLVFVRKRFARHLGGVILEGVLGEAADLHQNSTALSFTFTDGDAEPLGTL